MTADVEYRQALGAYLLGALEPAEEARLTEHLCSCARCHAELLDLGGVVADLAFLAVGENSGLRAEFERPPGPAATAGHEPPPPGPVHSTQRRRLFTAAAAGILVTAGAVGYLASRPEGHPTTGHTAEGRDAATGVAGHAMFTSLVWGTAVELTVSGTQLAVSPGVTCWLEANSRFKQVDIIGSWTVPAQSPTPDGEHICASTAIPLRQLASLVVMAEGGKMLLTLPIPVV